MAVVVVLAAGGGQMAGEALKKSDARLSADKHSEMRHCATAQLIPIVWGSTRFWPVEHHHPLESQRLSMSATVCCQRRGSAEPSRLTVQCHESSDRKFHSYGPIDIQ